METLGFLLCQVAPFADVVPDIVESGDALPLIDHGAVVAYITAFADSPRRTRVSWGACFFIAKTPLEELGRGTPD